VTQHTPRLYMLAAVTAVLGSSAAMAQHKLEISLETGPNHIRNIGVTEWAEELEKKSGGKLEVKVFHGAAKYKDTDVPKALNQGALDMGFPGTWQLGKFIPDFDAVDLPIFFGTTQEENYKVWDGPAGKALAEKFEKKLGVKVIGKWLDLGFQHTFSTAKAIKVHSDMEGMKIRIPGGSANIARYEAIGGAAAKIAWPDVPQALQRGTVDGLATTFESVRSAKLWDSGIKNAYMSQHSFSQYLPTVSAKSWAKYPPELQNLIVSTWAAKVDSLRERAKQRQESAKEDAKKNGIAVIEPTAADLAAARSKLMAKQDALVKELEIDSGFLKLVEASLKK
jgi:TRAP-type transport system periplasmic protein